MLTPKVIETKRGSAHTTASPVRVGSGLRRTGM